MTHRSRRTSPRLAQPFSPRCTSPEREPLSSPRWSHDHQTQRDLAGALGKFLYAPDWLASVRVLIAHPVLLTSRVSKLLREIADASRRHGNTADEITMLKHLALLEDVRRRGFFAVLNEFQQNG